MQKYNCTKTTRYNATYIYRMLYIIFVKTKKATEVKHNDEVA